MLESLNLIMTNEDLDERLREISATVLGIDSDMLSESSSPENLAAWTSIRHLSLIAVVEEAFSIQFSLAEIHGAQRFGELRRIVSERVTERSGHG
jgi:acyl carrier protein